MTSDALREIQRAEENGEQMIINATAQSRYKMEQIATELSVAKKNADAKFRDNYNSIIEEAKTEAKQLQKQFKEETLVEIEELNKKASKNFDETVNLIIEEILSEWQ